MKIRRGFVLMALLLLMSADTIAVHADPVAIRKGDGAEEAEPEENPYTQRLEKAFHFMRVHPVARYGMVPVYPADLHEGRFPIEAASSSVFFHMTEAEIEVAEGSITGIFTIPSLSYEYVYMGTAQEAERAEQDAWISGVEEGEKTVFSVPVAALDCELDCAAYSKKRKRWYDRKIVFDASTLSSEALAIEIPDYELIELALESYRKNGDFPDFDENGIPTESQDIPEAMEIARDDGEYSIEVNMTGGSGRASISSPTLLVVRDHKAYARLLWSSAYYDYLKIGGETYYNLTEDGGNSTFEIPITVMDKPMQVIGDTTAMGDPLEIAYTLTFYSESIGSKSQIPQEAAKKVLIIAAVLIIGGGILNHFIKRKKRK